MKLASLFGLLAWSVTSLFAADSAFDAWAEVMAAEMVCARQGEATASQYFNGAEQDALDRLLTPITKEFRAERVAAAKKALGELAKFDRAKLDGSQRTSAALIESIRATSFRPIS